MFGAVASGETDEATVVTRLAEPKREWETDGDREATADPELDTDRDAIADQIRDRGESVRRQELEVALSQLQASGEVSPAERRVLGALSARIADTLVERWASRVAEGEVDPEAALALLSE